MIDYYSYPRASLRRVVNPAHQASAGETPGPYNNKAFGIPDALLGRYYRPANPHSGTPEWWLPKDDPAWAECLSFQEALALYDGPAPVRPRPDPVKEARAAWWAKANALPGADDSLWRYGARSSEEAGEDYDTIVQLVDYSYPERPPTFPRRELRRKYGTVEFVAWAEQQIGPRP